VRLYRRTPMSVDTDQTDQAPPYGIVAIASSAGGITALGRVLGGFPAQMPVPIVVVQHLDPRHQTIIAEVMRRRTSLETKLAVDGERIVAGKIHIAPPNRHLLVNHDGTVSLTSSELVHFVRPSADLLFESVAANYGPAALACVLTGSGSDGAMGVTAIKSRGGSVIVQDPQSAEFKGMPEAAVAAGVADFVLPLEEVAPVICRLVGAVP
jgi:two-component system, chemotaxis family, protein-glutamate methylesterase/glutaminase